MENLTNFDTLIWMYLFITMGTLMYPTQLWFRVNFVNFIFMVLLTSSIFIFHYFILPESIFYSSNNMKIFDNEFLLTILFIAIGVSSYFRFTHNYSLLDSLFTGFFPFYIFYFIIYINFLDDFGILMNIFLFIMSYSAFIYQKMLYTIPFSIKEMADKY